MLVTGKSHVAEAFDHKRTFGEATLPFADARKLIQAVRYNALTGKGEQREINQPHAKKLLAALKEGTYTPVPVAASLTKVHREKLKVDNNGLFALEVSEDAPLLHTDGGHRFEMLGRAVTELENQLKDVEEGKEKDKLQRWLNQALSYPVTATIYFDGEPKLDFCRLQLGRPADSSHLLSLKVSQKIIDDPAFKLAIDVAKILHKADDSPFHNSIRFDSRGVSPLPISTLCSKGSSDIATSLVGLARVGLAESQQDKPRDATALAFVLTSAFKTLQKHCKELLEYGHVLTPLADNGTKGAATLLVGVATVLAYRLHAFGRSVPNESDLSRLADAADKALNEKVNGNFGGPVKRQLLGKFAKLLLEDVKENRHQDLPVELIHILSASTFNVDKPPKPSKTSKTTTEEAPSEAASTPAPEAPTPATEAEAEPKKKGRGRPKGSKKGTKRTEFNPAEFSDEVQAPPTEGEPVAVGGEAAPWEQEVQG